MKRILIGLAVAILALGTLPEARAESAHPQVKLTTSKGVITVELDRAKAPLSVNNFLAYAKSGFFNGTIFHRVIKGFMAQGGGLDENMAKKPTPGPRGPIKNEADNGLKNLRGTLAMARTGDPHSATNQFFINVADNAFLDHRSKSSSGWGYAVFGRVLSGMDVVDAIENTPTGRRMGRSDVPQTPIFIEEVVVLAE